MKQPTIDQIAKQIYLTMPLARRDQVMETAREVHALFSSGKIKKELNYNQA